MIEQDAQTDGTANESAADLGVTLAPGVRTRQCRDGLLVLAPDGVTALMFDRTDLAALHGVDTPARDQLIAELDHCGIRLGTPVVAPDSSSRRLHLTRRGIEAHGLDRLARRLHHGVGRTLRWAIAVVVALAVVVATTQLARGEVNTSATEAGLGPLTAAVVLFVIAAVLAAVHELGHAIALIGYGGRIGAAGFGFHWGAPSFYVDSTAALFLPRRQRVVQAAAGVGAELALATGVLAIAALIDTGPADYVATATLTYAVASLVVNGAPVLGLDGALIISDIADRPTLPTGAGRRTGRYSTALRVVDLTVGIAAIAGSIWIWSVLWWDLLGPLWASGLTGRLAVALTITPTVAAAVVGLMTLAHRDPAH